MTADAAAQRSGLDALQAMGRPSPVDIPPPGSILPLENIPSPAGGAAPSGRGQRMRVTAPLAGQQAGAAAQQAGIQALLTISTPEMSLPAAKATPRVVALIPAHNEEQSIGPVIAALLRQERVPDRIVVVCDNCSDRTEEIARRYPVTVMVTEGNRHRKPGALNMGWRRFARDAFMVVTIDADTVMPPNAVPDWLAEMSRNERLGGSSSKFTFTMTDRDFLTRLQRSEFSRWSDTSIRRGHTSVLAGTGCAIRGEALRKVAARPDRDGPWSYDSTVEDFELTYRIRQLGYRCRVSPTVAAYTDSMKTLRALWAQRMKWQVGTVEDLLSFGFNRLTARDWSQQALGLLSAVVRGMWLILWIAGPLTGWLRPSWTWWAFPAWFAVLDLLVALRIPGRDWKDLALAVMLLPNELFAWLRAGWFVASWCQVLFSRRQRDLWASQYAAER